MVAEPPSEPLHRVRIDGVVRALQAVTVTVSPHHRRKLMMARRTEGNIAASRMAWLGLATILFVGCAAGSPQFTSEAPAGFWLGIWHGLISCVTLVIGIFSDHVKVYEIDNSGGWYDFGFIIGVTALWGHRTITHRRKRDVPDAEWEDISRKVEAKFKRKIRQWAEAEPDENWNLVEQKAEAKLKRKVRDWAERA